MIVFVSDSKRTRDGERVRQRAKRHSRRELQRLRQRCYGSSSISRLLSGPWATQLPQSAAVPRAQNPMRVAQPHLFQLAVDPSSFTSLQKWLK